VIFTKFSVHVAYVRGLSSGMLTIGCIANWRERGDRSAQCRQFSVIYYCLVVSAEGMPAPI